MIIARLILTSALFLFAAPLAHAAEYYVSPIGNDRNDCSVPAPCATIFHVCDLIDAGPDGQASIHVADGTYGPNPNKREACNLYYDHVVTVYGDAAAPQNVVIQLKGNDTGFWVQDRAILGLNDVYITSSGANSIGIQSRQFSIADYHNVWFGALMVAASANENSKINCLGSAVVTSNETYYVRAQAHSQVDLSCQTLFYPAIAFASVVAATQEALITAGGATWAKYGGGAPSITGMKWTNDHSEIDNAAALPGKGHVNGGHGEVNE